MSTASHSLRIHGASVPVTAEPGVDVARVLQAPKFKKWADSMDKEITVRSVHVQSADFFGSELGFAKIKAEAYLDGHDAALPGIALLRGGSVAVLVVLSCDGEEFVLLTEQPRVPVGRARLLELPAGMMDDSGAFKGNAARELEEEAGLTVHDSELVDMTQLAFGEEQPGVYPSPGGLDEFMRLLLLRRRVAREELERIRSHAGGLREEGEIISLRMVPLRDLWHTCHDAKSLAALALYTQLREAGRLPEPLRE